MDSFVLSETLKYLYMIYAESSEMILDPDDYVLTTEAHFLPLNIGDAGTEEVFLFIILLISFLFYEFFLTFRFVNNLAFSSYFN